MKRQISPFDPPIQPTAESKPFHSDNGKDTFNVNSTETNVRRKLIFNNMPSPSADFVRKGKVCNSESYSNTQKDVEICSVSTFHPESDQNSAGSDLEKFYARRKSYKSKQKRKRKIHLRLRLTLREQNKHKSVLLCHELKL